MAEFSAMLFLCCSVTGDSLEKLEFEEMFFSISFLPPDSGTLFL